MPIAPDFSSVYEKEWEINFMQCSREGFMNYTDLCNILQLTASSHSELGGISFVDMQVHHQAWVLSRMRVEITEMPKWKDKITVKTWIKSMENSRSVRALEVLLDGKKVVGVETFWAVFNTQSRRPETIALPYSHFELFPNKQATEISFSKIEVPSEVKMLQKRKVVRSDLDFVNHVNHVKYLEWCLDLVDENQINNQKINSFEMNFLKELSLNDNVEINESQGSLKTIFCIEKANKACFALQINWD